MSSCIYDDKTPGIISNSRLYFNLLHSKHAANKGDTFQLTTIDSNSRKNLADFIEGLPEITCSYTCLAKGLETGLNVKTITFT